MKKLLLFIGLIFLLTNISAQAPVGGNYFKYIVKARGGIWVGDTATTSNAVRVDSIIDVDNYLIFYSGATEIGRTLSAGTSIDVKVSIADSTSYDPGSYETPTNVDNKILSTIGEGTAGLVATDTVNLVMTDARLATTLTGYPTNEALSDSLSGLSIEGVLMEADSLTKYVTIKRQADTIANLRYEIRNFELQFDQIYAALDELAEEDFTPPRFESAEVGDSANDLLIVVMDAGDINPDSIPMSTDFAFTENGNAFGIDTLLISNDSIYITLDSTAMYGATYLLSYTRPVTGALQDTTGNKSASWVNKPVTNNVVPSDLLSGAVSYYTLNETEGEIAYDSHGGNNMAIRGLTLGVAGKFGTAMETNATNVRYRSGSVVETGDEFTYAFWFKLNVLPSVSGRQNKLIYVPNTLTTFSVDAYLYGAGDVIRFFVKNTEDTSFRSNTDEDAFAVDAWYHLAFTLESDGDMVIYLDGVDVATTKASFTGTFADGDSYTQFATDGSNYFDGTMDEIVIYNKALNSTQIQELMTKTYPLE